MAVVRYICVGKGILIYVISNSYAHYNVEEPAFMLGGLYRAPQKDELTSTDKY